MPTVYDDNTNIIFCMMDENNDSDNFFTRLKFLKDILSEREYSNLLDQLIQYEYDPNNYDDDDSSSDDSTISCACQLIDFTEKTRDIDHDKCPICLRKIIKTSKIYYCQDCKNPIHRKCMDKYLNYKKECPICRSDIWQFIMEK